MARSFDDIKDQGLFSRRTEEIYKKRQDRIDQQSVAQFRIAEQIAENQKKVQEVINKKYKDADEQLEELTKLGLQYQNMVNLSQQIDSTSKFAAQKQFVSSMRTALGSKAVTHGIATEARSSQNLGATLGMARGMSTFQLEKQSQSARLMLEQMQPKIMEAIENVDQEGGKARLDYLSKTQDKLMRQAGLSESALGAQKKLGIYTPSRYFSAEQTMSRIQQDAEKVQIKEDVAAGRAGSRADVEQKLKTAADKLAHVFEQLSEAIENNTSDAKSLGEEFSKLEDQYKKHAGTLKEMDRQGVGGGGSFVDRLKEAGGIISDTGVVTQGLAQGYRTNYITSEIQQTQNRIQYAQLANQRFEDVYGATQGDMSALRRVLSNQYGEQARRGAEYRDREQKAVGGETIGRGGQLLGRVADEATSLETIWQGMKGAFASALGTAGTGAGAGGALGAGVNIAAKSTPDALEFNRLLTDYRKDISAGQTDVSVQQQFRQLQDTISNISDFSSQKTYDYYKDLTLATRGLGLGTNFGPTEIKTYKGSGRMGAEAGAAADMLDTDAVSLDENKSLVDVLKRSAEEDFEGYNDSEKSVIRQNVDQDRKRKLQYQIRGQQERNKERGFFGAIGDAFWMGPSDEELQERGRELMGPIAPTFDKAKSFIKGKEGLSLSAYRDTSRGYSIGYGHFQEGTAQRGKTITQEEADSLFEKDFASHAGQVDKLLGKDVVGGLNEDQRGALYSLAYNAGPGALEYGGKGSIASRLKAGDISGAGQKILSTAVTSDGAVNQALVARRQQEFQMFTGQEVDIKTPSRVPSPFQRTAEGIETQGAVGGGGDRELVMSTLMNKDMIKQLAYDAGLGTKDIPGLIGGFRSQIGKEVTGGLQGQAGVDVLTQNVTRAGQLARAGYLESPEQYVQARGALTGVGGSGEDLEKIMRNAVAAGMDSSKNIMEMVGAVQELSQTSAGAGINAVAATTGMLGRGVQDLRSMGVERNMAARAAKIGAATASDWATSGDMDIFNVMEFAGLRSDFEDAKIWQLEAMQTADPKELEQLRKLQKIAESGPTKEAEEARKKAAQLAEQMGLGGVLTDSSQTEKVLNRTREQVGYRQTGIGMDFNLEREHQEELKAGKTLSQMRPEVRNFVNARTRQTANRSTAGGAVTGAIQYEGETKEGDLSNQPQGKYTGGGEAGLQSNAIGDAKVFADGVANFKEAIGDISQVGTIMKDIAERGLNLEQFKKDVSDAAGKMKTPLEQFTKGLSKFNTSVSTFTTEMNKLIDRVEGKVKQVSPHVPSIQQQGTTGKKKDEEPGG